MKAEVIVLINPRGVGKRKLSKHQKIYLAEIHLGHPDSHLPNHGYFAYRYTTDTPQTCWMGVLHSGRRRFGFRGRGFACLVGNK